MTKLKLAINDKIEIMFDNKVYKSNVQDITEEHIAISVPTNKGKYLLVEKKDKVDVIYIDKRAIFKFESVVIGRRKEVIPVILLSIPEEVTEIQRRLFVRVPVVEYINYICYSPEKILNSASIDVMMQNELFLSKGDLIDLSGGGMKIKIKDKVSIGDYIIGKIKMMHDEIVVKGKIIRIEKDQDDRNVCGVNFEDMSDKDSDKIIRYLFEVMRKQMGRS